MKNSLLSKLVISSILLSILLANSANSDTLQESLKGIKRYSGVCHRNDQQPALSSITTTNITPDLSCAISVQASKSLLSKADSILIDMRQSAEFNNFHIQNAINVSSAELHSKAYWKNKNILMLGNGKNEIELYRECHHLKKLGYKSVKVMRGGMLAWISQKQPTEGYSPEASQMARLSSADLLVESHNPANLFLLEQTRADMNKYLAKSQLLPRGADAIQADTIRKQQKANQLTGLVLIADTKIKNQQIQQIQQKIAPATLLVYSGSSAAYAKEIESQKAIWQEHAKGPKKLGCGL